MIPASLVWFVVIPQASSARQAHLHYSKRIDQCRILPL
jgi:hypothetical protein